MSRVDWSGERNPLEVYRIVDCFMGRGSRRRSRGAALTVLLFTVCSFCGLTIDVVDPIKGEDSNGILRERSESGGNLRSAATPLPARIVPAPRGVAAVLDGGATPAPLNDSDACASSSCFSYVLSSCNFDNFQTVEWVYAGGRGTNASLLQECCEGKSLPETALIKCDHVAWHSGEGVAVGMLAGLGMGVSLFFALALRWYKQSKTVRQGYPRFSLALVLGAGVMCASALTLLGRNTSFSCAIRLWWWSTGFDLAFGALVLKLWRAPSAAVESSTKFDRVSFIRWKVRAILASVLVGDVAVIASWTADSGSEHCRVYSENVGEEAIERTSCLLCCRAHFFSWVALKVVLVSMCWYANFRTRKTKPQMAETGMLAMVTYNLAVAALLVAAVLWANANAQVRTTTKAMATTLVGIGTLCVILAPKIFRAKQELEGKALVGPSAIVTTNTGDALYAGDTTNGEGDGNGSGSGASGSSSQEIDPLRRMLSRQGSGGSSSLAVSVAIFGKPMTTVSDVFPDVEGSPTSAAVNNDGDDGSGADRRIEPTPTSNGGFFAAGNGIGIGAGKINPPGSRNLATSGGVVTPDPVGFWTPQRPVRHARSSAEVISRSAGGQALTTDKLALTTSAVTVEGDGEDDGEGGSTLNSSRRLSHSGRGGRDTSSTASPSVERRSGGGHAIALPMKRPPSGASGSSRVSRVSHASSSRAETLARSSRTPNSGGSRWASDDYLSSLRSSADSWNADPLTVRVKGFGWSGRNSGSSSLRQSGGWLPMNGVASSGAKSSGAGGGGGVGLSRRKSGPTGGRNRSGVWSSGGRLKRGRSKERPTSVGSAGIKRSNAVGCLVMHADTGTRLHCPHCDEEVAGCGFKGCSGSLIRAPSFTDDDGGPDTLPYRRVYIPPLPPRLSMTGPAGDVGLLRDDHQSRSTSQATGAPAVAISPTHSLGSQNRRPGLLRRSFRLGPSPCDTFDDDTDSSMDGRSRGIGGEGERSSAFAAASPASSYAWP